MRLLYTAIAALLLTSCANIIPPTGGPQDTIPPTLLKSYPKDGEINFTGEEISLEFDEAIQLKDAKEEIIITPSVGKETQYLFKKNTVTIKPEEKFQKDVTYSIAFRQSIVDLNESNPAEDLHLAFSTGPYIDSLSIFGRVKTAAESKPAEKFTVALYQQDTFDIYKHTPIYVTRTNNLGRFVIRNLKPGRYNVYAFNDKNKNLKVDTQSEWFGTAAGPVNLPEHKDSLSIAVVRVDMRPLKLNSARGLANTTTIRLNKPPANYSLKLLDEAVPIVSHYNATRSEISAYPPKPAPDSSRVRLLAADSVDNRIDTIFYIKQTKQKSIKDDFKATYKTQTLVSATRKLHAEVIFTAPIQRINPDSIRILNDSIPLQTLKATAIAYDSSTLKLTIDQDLSLPDSLLQKKIILDYGTGWAISLFGDSLKRSSQRIIVKTPPNMATIAVAIKSNITDLIVQVLNERYEVIETQALSKINTFKNLDASGTIIRAFQDLNKNAVWDFGNPRTNMQPEPVWIYADKDNKRPVPLRANWIVEADWTIR